MAKVTGGKGFRDKLAAMSGPELGKQVGAALFAAGNLIETEAALSITNGAVSGKGHVPSKPGEPPNADTHVLDRSIETVAVGPLKVEVSANAPYAAFQEFGTSRMAERPYMRPAVEKNRVAVTKLVSDAVIKVARGGRVV